MISRTFDLLFEIILTVVVIGFLVLVTIGMARIGVETVFAFFSSLDQICIVPQRYYHQ